MSSELALVRFPDGTVKVTWYYGSSDTIHPSLADSRDAWRGDIADWLGLPPAPDEPVTIFTAYGGGFWWEGRATLLRVTVGTSPYGVEDQGGRQIVAPCQLHDGRPAWVDEWDRANSVTPSPKE